jgi:hypothetical protein
MRAQAKPITNMPEVMAATRSIDLGLLPALMKSKCLARLPSRYA